ncbi:MAG TPA: hypothetical protein VKV15_03880 [Bryobacteraceae bacterium]|nr:hypothetical protein [Bryobacteraceae bacterium]
MRDLTWIKEHVHFDPPALEATLQDYVHEVDHIPERIQGLEKAITAAIQTAPPAMRIGGFLLKRQQGLDPEVKDIAWKAQWRLHTRYKKLAAVGRRNPDRDCRKPRVARFYLGHCR